MNWHNKLYRTVELYLLVLWANPPVGYSRRSCHCTLSFTTGIYGRPTRADYEPSTYNKRPSWHVAGLCDFAAAINSVPISRIRAPNYDMGGAIGGQGAVDSPIIWLGATMHLPPPPIFDTWISYFSTKLGAEKNLFSTCLHSSWNCCDCFWLNAITSACPSATEHG